MGLQNRVDNLEPTGGLKFMGLRGAGARSRKVAKEFIATGLTERACHGRKKACPAPSV